MLMIHQKLIGFKHQIRLDEGIIGFFITIRKRTERKKRRANAIVGVEADSFFHCQ
jgi:hypothetical protein